MSSENALYNPIFNDAWEQFSLHELAGWKNGIAFRNNYFCNEGKPVIKIAELKNGISDQTKYSDQTFDSAYYLTKKDLLFSWSGSPETSIDVFWYDLPDGWLNQHIFKVTPFDKVTKDYMFYVLKYLKPIFIEIAKNKQTTGLGHVTMTDLKNILVRIPKNNEQRAIAATLSALDDKIELNNRINKTLEEMAQTLFKQWFVDFEFPDENGLPNKSAGGEMVESELGLIPKGWKVGELDQVIEIYDSQRIPLAGNVRSGRKGIYPYYGAASIMDYIDTWIFDGIYLLLAEDGSVVTANDGPVLQYAWGKFWVNNHAHVLQGKNGFSVEQLLLLLQRVNVRPYITGAVQLKINQANLKRIPVVIPTQDICLNFNKVIEKQFAMIRDNINETNILGILRDALLPKLMSGEIRVAIEEVAADV